MKKIMLNIQKFATAMTSTLNYSGMLRSKVDESTRFLDAIYSRGKNGGSVTNYSEEFVLSSGYELEDPSQPAITETASLTAPDPVTVERTQEYNVHQIYHETVAVSYAKQSNRDALSGVNVAGATNNVPNELDFQIGKRITKIRRDLNYTSINGVYQYTKGNVNVARKSRGMISAVATNNFDCNGAVLSKELINSALVNAISNGANPTSLEIWVNPSDLAVITNVYSQVAGATLPASRTEGGVAITSILTSFGVLNVDWDAQIPAGTILLVNMSEVAVSEKPYFNENGENLGVLFYEPLAKTGASERGQIYGELGLDYGAEWLHAKITNFEEPTVGVSNVQIINPTTSPVNTKEVA
jgi:hypothetical protein